MIKASISNQFCNGTAWPLAGPKLCFPFICVGNFKCDCQDYGKQNIPHHLRCCPVGVVSAFHSSSWIFSFTPMGSGDVILCADHPILGQAVIVLHLDYPNCYESQDAFSSGHVECTSLPHLSDVFEFSPYFYKHWNAGRIHSNIGILAPSFQTLEFSPHFYKHWTSGPIHSNTGILAPSFQTLEFSPCFYKHWNSGLILSNIGILVLSFPTFKFCPYLFKQWYSGPVLSNIGIPDLSF